MNSTPCQFRNCDRITSPSTEKDARVAASQRIPHPFFIHPVRVWNCEGSMNPNQMWDTSLDCRIGHEVPVILQDAYLCSRESVKVGSHSGNDVCHQITWIPFGRTMSFRCTTNAPIGTLESTGCQGGYEPPFANCRCLIPDDRRVPEQSPDGARIRSETEWSPTVG